MKKLKLILSLIIILALAPLTLATTADVLPPKGELTIQNAILKDGKYFASQKELILNITASDNKTQNQNLKMLISAKPLNGDELADSTKWIGYSSLYNYTVEANAGDTTRIYVYLKDEAGNISPNVVESTKKFTITYVAEGATNVPEAQTAICGVPLMIPAQEPKMADKYFKGWSLSSNATTESWLSESVVEPKYISADATLYAVWGDTPRKLSEVVKVGDFVEYPVSYTNVHTNGDSNISRAQAWRVLDITGDTIKLISSGTPLVYEKNGTNSEAIEDLTTNFLNGTSANYKTYGFTKNLSEVFNNAYTKSVESIKESDVTKLTGETNLTNLDVSDYGGTLINNTYYFIVSESDNNVYCANGDTGIIGTTTGTAYGVRPVVTLSDKALVTGRNSAGRWELAMPAIDITLNDGTSTTIKKLTIGKPYGELPTPTKTGYTFDGWHMENNQKVSEETIVPEIGGTPLLAKWEAETYTVTFNANEGTIAETGGATTTRTVKYGDTYGETTSGFPEAEQSGYIFLGWFTEAEGGEQITAETIVTESAKELKLYAHWEVDPTAAIPSIANAPLLGEGMKAVYWTDDNGNGETISDTYPEGTYNYAMGDGRTDTKDSKWANAITEEDGSYWVWIPRYAYKIIYYNDSAKTTVVGTTTETATIEGEKSLYGDINILFMYGTSETHYRDKNGNAVELPEGYKLHPAFQRMTTEQDLETNPLGKWDEELTGIWVAKYEASMETLSGGTWTNINTSNSSIGNVTTSSTVRMVSKPSVISWRTIGQNYIYQNSLNMHTALNSHEMKNSEWGAVAYLTHSSYGRNSKEIAPNQCSSYYTGAGPRTGASGNGTYEYDASNFASTYAWNTAQGKLASTTGNIYGVYDLSGGAYEYTAAYVNNGKASLTSNLVNATDLKTKQVYASTVTDGSNSQSADYALAASVYGDAVYETSRSYSSTTSWNGESSLFPNSDYPFFKRGGYYDFTDNAGVFHFSYDGRSISSKYGFRPVLCVGTAHTVTYNANGGTIVGTTFETTTRKVAEGTTYGSATYGMPEAIKRGHIFLGWYTELEGGTQITADIIADGTAADQTLYAHWEVAQPTVTFNSNKGSFDTGTTNTLKYTFVENDTEIVPSILEGEYKEPTRSGYEFMGWSKTSDATKVEYQPGINNIPDESGTVYAVWAITVTFNANSGTITGLGSAQTTRILIPGSKYEDASAGFPATTRSGYTFLGWYTETDEQITATSIVNENLNGKTLTAKWQATSYTISYTLNGGSITGTNPTTYTIESENITLINPTKSGYGFAGWTGTGVSTAQTTVTILKGSTGNKTYTANWRAERELIASIANEPVLGTGMKAVYWTDDNGNGETISTTYPEGTYNYTQGNGITDTKETKWANAVTTSDGSYWVWIPRYAYKITYYTNANKTTVSTNKTKYGDIDVLFLYGTSDTQYRDINGNAVELPDGYIVHPAFQAMTTTQDLATNPLGKWDEELEGIWVAKYEASRETSSDSGSTWVAAAGTNGLTATGSSRVVSKPSVTSWRSITQNYIYQNSLNMHPTLNSHEMKNSEWGAVAYLTQSAYGRNGNEIAVNQCTGFYTGAGPGTGTSIIYNSTYAYDASTFASTYAWNTAQGKLASTTGNIYGVYDMSGGAWEYVAAYVNNGHSNITGTSYGGVLGTSTDLKTKQIYALSTSSDSNSNNYSANSSVYGDAVYETSISGNSSGGSWNSDYSIFPNSSNPFFGRGGYYINAGSAGVFYFYGVNGCSNPGSGFRPVLCVASGT